MWKDTCILEVRRADDNKNKASCSGIVLNSHRGLIISHGSLLWPILDPEHKSKLLNQGQMQSHDLSRYDISIVLERCKNASKHGKMKKDFENRSIHGDPGYFLTPNKCDAPIKEDSQLVQCSGQIKCIWKSTAFAKTLDRLMPKSDGWKFSDESNIGATKTDSNGKNNTETPPENNDNDTLLALPIFMLIEIEQEFRTSDNYWPVFTSSLEARQGERVSVVGTPFGALSPAVFANSVSQGVLSNVIGYQGEMLLTDARAIPGTEGGAIYDKNGGILGMLVASLCWKSNEWIGLSIGCSLQSVIKPLLEKDTLRSPAISSALQPLSGEKFISATLGGAAVPSDFSSYQVVLVRCGGSWGSGVVVDPHQGVLLTCSHVVRGFNGGKVTVVKTNPRRQTLRAEVVFSCPPGEVYDIAVLKLDDPGFREKTRELEQPPLSRAPRQGETVYAVGHACFSEHSGLQPSITKGAVSKVISYGSETVMIQSTCAVHAGASGGPLVTKDGTVIGLLTCNAKDTVSGSSYPHVNMSVPLATVWPVISTYLKTKDPAVLHDLCIRQHQVKALWNLKDEISNLQSKL